ncbi:hypothetical protein SAMN05216353_1463 [Halobacillus alkaliphilus]|uniref:Amino acid transporter n=1 Tax=Halobacillus alkaliphilus TaxID=396056 RepID=A0A1I2S1I2_9BACI|nr:hypothetical protein SAMN05216353_1463 [Halobacillus alkaliphilus]
MSSNNDDKPFNDAIEHQQKNEGYPKPSEGKLPLPIRLSGYFLFGGIVLMILLGLLGNILF